MKKGTPRSGVRPLTSALRTLAVLDVLGRSDRPLRLVEVALAVADSRATAYQKLVTLIAAGWVEQTEDGAYRLSLHAAHMGEAALDQASLGERATVIMRELVQEVRETASLAVLSGINVQLVKRVEAEVVVRAQVRVGSLLSLDNSSSGRAITAFAAPHDIQALVAKGAVLASSAVLEGVRRNGYAISTGKDTPGVRSVAAPIHNAKGKCVGALSVVAPASRFEAARYVHPLKKAAERMRAVMSIPNGRGSPIG
jgi:DNA-binding IclR family transcriptional regulator